MTTTPKLNGYTIKKELGHGGMATVFLAEEERSGRAVAIKWYVPTLFGDNRGNHRFLKETRLMKKLSHPNIVTVYDAGLHDEYGYLVMEYLPASLSELIKKTGGIERQQAVNICMQIADALFFLHKNGIVHRDIKPENILLRKDGTPVLVDFGIAKPLESQTQLTKTGVSIGTPLYMSPEQCQAKKVDGRSDIYSLGVLFFEMLTAAPPYTAKDSRTIMVKHIQEEPPKLPFRLRSCQDLCDALMAKKPSQRPISMAALQKLAAAALSDEPGAPKKQATRQTVTLATRQIKSKPRVSKAPRPAPRKGKNRQGIWKSWLWSVLLLAFALWLAHLLGLIHLPLRPGLE